MNANDEHHQQERLMFCTMLIIFFAEGTIIEFNYSQILTWLTNVPDFFTDRRKSSIGGETTLSRLSHKSSKSNKSGFGRVKSNDRNISLSSSCSESENDTEIEVVLHKSRHNLENTEALKIRRNLLRPEDYVSAGMANRNRNQSLTPFSIVSF